MAAKIPIAHGVPLGFAFAWVKGRQMDVTGLRVALFSGNYNYVRDGANQALNRFVGYLLRQGAAVRIDSPTGQLLGESAVIRPTTDSVAPPSRLRFRSR